MVDTPKVAFNNIIKKAVLTKGRSIGDLDSVFDNDTANSYQCRSDLNGNVVIDVKTLSSTSLCAIFGSHRYDASGQTIDFNYNIEANDGTSFSSIASGSFVNQKESLFTKTLAHTLGVPSVPSLSHSGVDIFKKVVWAGNQFLAISSNKLFKSVDGVTWVQDPGVPAGVFNDIKGLEDFIIICGNAGYFSYFDGSVWTQKTVTVSNLHCVATNGINFITAGENNEVWTTSDLINFNQEVSPDSGPNSIFLFAEVVGFGYNLSTNVISYSSFDDGSTYSVLYAAASQTILDVKVFNNTLYIAGDPGIVLKSIDLTTYDDISFGVNRIEGISLTNTEILTFSDTGVIHISEDDGITWSVYNVTVSNGSPNSVLNSATNGVDFIICNTTDTEILFVKNRYRISYSGMLPLTDFLIPEFFIGDFLDIGHVNYGVDPKSLRNGIKKFNSENGRVFESVLWKRLELSFSLSVINNTTALNIESFRNHVYEKRDAIWFMFLPDTDPYSTYLMKIKGDIDIKILSPVHKSTSLKFVEFI